MSLDELLEHSGPLALSSEVMEELIMPELFDKTGNRISINTILAYACRKGSNMWHNFGIVTEIMTDEHGQHKLRLLGIGDHHIGGLGTVLRERHVTITKWQEAIVIRPENIVVERTEDPSLVWCVQKWHELQLAQMEALLQVG